MCLQRAHCQDEGAAAKILLSVRTCQQKLPQNAFPPFHSFVSLSSPQLLLLQLIVGTDVVSVFENLCAR